ncbi:MAG: hypothetical protein COB01_05090 [Lutibacter sp.]|nr:MAG: hypothetical protein COB01_05090 [Lutibacter sp.]
MRKYNYLIIAGFIPIVALILFTKFEYSTLIYTVLITTITLFSITLWKHKNPQIQPALISLPISIIFSGFIILELGINLLLLTLI